MFFKILNSFIAFSMYSGSSFRMIFTALIYFKILCSHFFTTELHPSPSVSFSSYVFSKAFLYSCSCWDMISASVSLPSRRTTKRELMLEVSPLNRLNASNDPMLSGPLFKILFRNKSLRELVELCPLFMVPASRSPADPRPLMPYI